MAYTIKEDDEYNQTLIISDAETDAEAYYDLVDAYEELFQLSEEEMNSDSDEPEDYMYELFRSGLVKKEDDKYIFLEG